jgi:hypothetical protein
MSTLKNDFRFLFTYISEKANITYVIFWILYSIYIVCLNSFDSYLWGVIVGLIFWFCPFKIVRFALVFCVGLFCIIDINLRVFVRPDNAYYSERVIQINATPLYEDALGEKVISYKNRFETVYVNLQNIQNSRAKIQFSGWVNTSALMDTDDKEYLVYKQNQYKKETLAKITPIDIYFEAIRQAKTHLKLKTPSTAKFASYEESEIIKQKDAEDIYSVISYVDSQNSFGAMLRMRFLIKLRMINSNSSEAIEIHVE